MCPNLQFPADLVTFTEEILNGKLHFLCNEGSFIITYVFNFSPLIWSWYEEKHLFQNLPLSLINEKLYFLADIQYKTTEITSVDV